MNKRTTPQLPTADTLRYNGSDELTKPLVTAVCANVTCNRRDSWTRTAEDRSCGIDPETGRNLFVQNPGRGRKGVYCSDACKVNAAETRRSERLAHEAQLYREAQHAEHQRRLASMALQRERQVENVIALALAQTLGERPNSRPTTTTLKAAAEHITRSLMLADLIAYKPMSWEDR